MGVGTGSVATSDIEECPSATTIMFGALSAVGRQSKGNTPAALRAGRLNINAPMSVAVTGVVVIGHWTEAAKVMALYAIAELIEAKAVERARNAITELMAMAPETATLQPDNGQWQVRRVTDVPLHAIVCITPGERVPLDGVVVTGSSSSNQAPVTGERMPVDKEAGDSAVAVTINENGPLEIEATTLAATRRRGSSTRSSRRRPSGRRRSTSWTDSLRPIRLPCSSSPCWLPSNQTPQRDSPRGGRVRARSGAVTQVVGSAPWRTRFFAPYR